MIMIKSPCLIVLYFNWVKQLPGVDTRTTISRIIGSKTTETDLASSDLLNAYGLHLNNPTAQHEESCSDLRSIF